MDAWRSALNASRNLVRQKGIQYCQQRFQEDGTKQRWARKTLIGCQGRGIQTIDPLKASQRKTYTNTLLTKSIMFGRPPPVLQPQQSLRLAGLHHSWRSTQHQSQKSSPQSSRLQTRLLKKSIELFAPFITTLHSISLAIREFTALWKHAIDLVLICLTQLIIAQSQISLSELLERILNI